MFPTPEQIAATARELLRGPQRRIDSLVAAAALLASGELELGYGDDLPGLRSKLLPLAGVGPWTVGYVAMRVIGAPDIYLGNDAAVRNGIRAVSAGRVSDGLGAEPAVALSSDFSEVSPWRSYATMHLWRAAAAAPKTGTPKTGTPKPGTPRTSTPKTTITATTAARALT
jgi:AraC family transcriptional regulator of adaptative response / DNA-3-methyladenine glycosylase II